MKLTIFVAVTIGVLGLAWQAFSAECPVQCPSDWKWQCGRERQPDGSWKYVNFRNWCYLERQNICFKSNYVPCIN